MWAHYENTFSKPERGNTCSMRSFSLSPSFQVHCGSKHWWWITEVRRLSHRDRRSKRVSHGITRQRDHTAAGYSLAPYLLFAAYSRFMCGLVDEMWSIPLTFHREKMLIRHVLTARAVGCENPLSSHISSRSECFLLFILFIHINLGAFWDAVFHQEMRGKISKSQEEAWAATHRSCAWLPVI